MDESVRGVELLVGQLDKRMAFIEQNMMEIRSELAQLRGEMSQLRIELTAEMRTTLRWMITTMIALFAVAMPAWMWILGVILKVR